MAKILLGNAIRVANSWGFPKREPGLIQKMDLHLQSKVGGSLTCCRVCIHPTACLKPAQSWSHAGYCNLCNLHFFLWSYSHFPPPELREITMDIFQSQKRLPLSHCGLRELHQGLILYTIQIKPTVHYKGQRLIIWSLGKSDCHAGNTK